MKGDDCMINYSPLLKLLIDLKILNFTNLCNSIGINPVFGTKIKRNDYINLSTLNKVMNYLVKNYSEEIKKIKGRELRIEDVIEWRRDND
jgi:hypothetical protein